MSALDDVFGRVENFAGTATASLGGGIAGAIASARQAAKNRNFQRHMMQNRYQYQVADMRKAGINPMLAFSSNPPMPGGSTASIGNPASGAAQAGLSAPQKNLIRNQSEAASAQAHANEAQAAKAANEAQVSALTAQSIAYDNVRRKEEASYWSSDAGRAKLRAQLGAQGLPFGMDYVGAVSGLGTSSTARQAAQKLRVGDDWLRKQYQTGAAWLKKQNVPISWEGNDLGKYLNNKLRRR